MLDDLILSAVIDTRREWLTPLVIAFTTLTRPLFILGYALLLGLWRRSVFPPLAVGAANLLSHLLKELIDRPRPDPAGHLVTETNPAMPSGHAVGAAAFAMVITLLFRRWWALWLWLLALLVGLSRLYIGVHWPSDLLIGWALGAGVAALMWPATSRSCRRPRRTPS